MRTRIPSLSPPAIGLVVWNLVTAVAVFLLFGLVYLVFYVLLGLLFIHRKTRTRGSGWLVCPSCNEHASQDVVDELVLVGWWWLRLSPIRRSRLLVCRRCGYRRAAGTHSLSGWNIHYDDEMRALDTAGQPIHHAWMFPVGLFSFLAVTGTAYFAIFATPSNSFGGITYATHPTAADKANPKFQQIAADLTFDVPSSVGNYLIVTEATPPQIVWSDTSGQNLSESVVRDDTAGSLADLVTAHFNDERGLSDVGFPTTPPAGQCTKVDGQPAYTLTLKFTQSGQPSVIEMWVVMHDGVGYIFSFGGSGTDGISTINAISRHVISSVHFSGTETPAPTPTPSPSLSPPPATATPSPSAGTESASPTPAPINCS